LQKLLLNEFLLGQPNFANTDTMRYAKPIGLKVPFIILSLPQYPV